jgi:uncharacterized membrane protein (UPF0136 family)
MNTVSLIAFAVTFLGGPLVCALILRMPPRLPLLAGLSVAVVVTVSVALWQQERHIALSLAAMWLGWVLAVAMVAQAIRRRLPAPQTQRVITVIAILATTLPWFGLATARMLSGA